MLRVPTDTPSAPGAEPSVAPGAPRQPKPDGRARRHTMRRLLLGLLALGLVAGGIQAWRPKPLPVEMATVKRGPMTVTLEEDGIARVKDRFVVSAPVTGHLSRITLDAGDAVEEGQVLARITPLPPPLLDERTRLGARARLEAAIAALAQLEAQIERSRVRADYTQTEAGRTARLFEQRAASQQQLDEAQQAARVAAAEARSLELQRHVGQHEVERSRAELRQLSESGRGASQTAFTVRAPIAAQVLKVIQPSEGAIQAGAPLLELGDVGRLEIVVDLLTTDAPSVHPGMRARIEGWGGPPLEARVRSTEPSAFTHVSSLGIEEQRVNVLLDVTAPPEMRRSLGDGYRIEAHIELWSSPSAVTAPASAVFRSGQGWALFRVDRGRARLQPIQIGHRTAAQVEILDGLAPETRVIIHPGDQIHDGVAVAERTG